MWSSNNDVIIGKAFAIERPTRVCLVCEKYENTQATIGDLGTPWLCNRCKNRLRELIGIEVSEEAEK